MKTLIILATHADNNPGAVTRVAHIPELIEHIIQYASIGDTYYRLQRVNKEMYETIRTSTAIQRAMQDKMYGPPIRTFAGLRILQALPYKIMKVGQSNSIVVRVHLENSSEKAEADKVVQCGRWRNALVSMPPIQRMTGFGPCGGPAGILAASSEAVTLGDLYDAAMRAVFKHKTCAVCQGKGYFEVHFGHMYYRPGY